MDQMIHETCLYKKVRLGLIFGMAYFLFLWPKCLEILFRGDGNKFMSASYGVKKNDVLLEGFVLVSLKSRALKFCFSIK